MLKYCLLNLFSPGKNIELAVMRRGKPLEILDTKTVEKLVEETEKERDAEAEAKKKAAGKS